MNKPAVSYLSDITLRRGIVLFLLALAVLVGGTWMTIKLTANHFIREDARDNAVTWANSLAAHVPDLEQIASGERPSAESLAFFSAARSVGHVFRYVIYDRQGYSQLISNADGVSAVDIPTSSSDALEAIKSGSPVVTAQTGWSPDGPAYFAEAFVPVEVGGKIVAIVAASIDETAQRARFYEAALLGSLALCSLTALAFAIPAIAWYRRTREKQRADRHIRFLAHHDSLTGLANRARLIERLDAAMALLPATGRLLAVHYLDIDNFKQVNDTLGHDGGDFLLSTIGKRLSAVVRQRGDAVARLGGDEFVLVQSGITSKQDAEAFAGRIASVISAPTAFREQLIQAHATIGIALAPADGATPERLLKSADLALYDGKSHGRNRIRFFSPEMDVAMQERVRIERILRSALDRNAIEIYYQPIFEKNGDQLTGFEALARLSAPDGTLIPPAVFIPLAEELRLIDRLGEWVLREACKAAQSWPETLSVAVNLSPVQFEDGNVEGIEEMVASALQDSGLAPRRLELEITETLLLRNSDAVMVALHKLKEMGVSIVMDDFGTGYSSLSYLWKFPFDKIKIDRSFMENFEHAGRDVETVVKTIIALGRELKMRVTVEGVETPEEVDFLYDVDADQVQGFYFGRPMPASQVAASIVAQLRRTVAPGADGRSKDGSAPLKRAGQARR
jgi:diguanylate cyclase (GGDEF)-like protein